VCDVYLFQMDEVSVLRFLCLDNTPAACSSTLIRLSSLSNAEDDQVYQFSNGSDPSLVSDEFDAECSQADGDCMEINMKNSKVKKREELESGVFLHKPITKYRELAGQSMESVKFKEFEDTQHGNKQNYESFVLPNRGAEFARNGEGLEEPRSGVNSEVRSQENSEETEEKIWRVETWRYGRSEVFK